MFDGVAIHTEVAFTSLGPLAVRNALREPTAPYLLFAMTGSEIRAAGQVWRCFAEKTPQIERARVHRQFSVGRAGPQFFWSIAIQLHSVFIRVTQVNRFTHTMVGSAF